MEVACEVWWVAADYVLWQRLVRWLNQTEQMRMHALRRDEDRERFVLGAVLARVVVSSRLGVSVGDVHLDRRCTRCGAPHGKPRLADPDVALELSVTHSGRLVGVSLAQHVAVGIDVEQLTDDRDVASIAPSVLTAGELAALDRGDATDDGSSRTARFLQLWTRKEALTKMVGRGLNTRFTDIQVSGPDDHARVLSWAGDAPRADEVSLVDLTPPTPAYVASIATMSASARVVAFDGRTLLADL